MEDTQKQLSVTDLERERENIFEIISHIKAYTFLDDAAYIAKTFSTDKDLEQFIAMDEALNAIGITKSA